MKRDRIHDSDDEQRNSDEEQLRMNTTNETIREASGDRDMDLNELKGENADSDYDTPSQNSYSNDVTQGVSYDPNDASGVRSGGASDMDDQTTGGAGLNTGARRGSGSNLTPKMGTTGSDYDGQNSTS